MSSKLPVLLLIFNRKDHALKALEPIRRYAPEVLYVAADGPRQTKAGEDQVCLRTREAVIAAIDWNCQVKTLFREENKGCAQAVNEAVTWFFSNEEYGIICEDDVCLSDDFFPLCEELLPHYANEDKVMLISAQNFKAKAKVSNTYTFSNSGFIWGWASWRRAWAKMDMSMAAWPSWPKRKLLRAFGLFKGLFFVHYWNQAYNAIHSGLPFQSWATRWVFSIILNEGLCVEPCVNLTKNTGIGGVEGAHYEIDDVDIHADVGYGRLQFPLDKNVPLKLDKAQMRLDRKDFFIERMYGLRKKLRRIC